MGDQLRRGCSGALRAPCQTGGSRVSKDLSLDLFRKILKFHLGAVPSPWLDRHHGLSLVVMDPRCPNYRRPSLHNRRAPPLPARRATTKGGHLHRGVGPGHDQVGSLRGELRGRVAVVVPLHCGDGTHRSR